RRGRASRQSSQTGSAPFRWLLAMRSVGFLVLSRATGMVARPVPRLTTCLLAALLALLCAPAARAAAPPPCFGAAALDPEPHPSTNPDLRLSVEPWLEDALILPSAPCEPIESETTPRVCWFGTPKDKAKRIFALIGDSHAVHWRAAMTVVAKAKGW